MSARPFLIGKLYARDERPGPYPTGNLGRAELAALGAQLAAQRRWHAGTCSTGCPASCPCRCHSRLAGGAS